METNYTRRRRGGQFSESGASRYAALAQLEKRDDETIRGMERQAQSAKEVARNWGDAYERARGREVTWLASLKVDEDKIHANKIRANKIRGDREVEALLEKSKFYERESKIWSTFTASLGGELAKAGVKAFEAYQTAQARKNYEMPDFTAGYAYKANANADAQTKLTIQTIQDLLNDKTLTVAEKAATIKQVTNESSLIQEGFFSQDWLDNLDVIVSSTKRDAGKLYNSTNVKELLELRAHLYLQGNQIDATSKAGLEILQKTNKIAGIEEQRLALASKGKVDTEELTAGARAVRVAYKSKDPKRIQASLNALAVIAQGSVINVDGKWVSSGDHDMNLPEAMEHILPYIKRSHPDMTWADIEKILGSANVPATNLYEFKGKLSKKDKKKYQDSEHYKQIVREGGDPYDAAAQEGWHLMHNLPTWAEALKNRGYTEIAKKAWISEEKALDELNTETADSKAVTDAKNWGERFTNKESENYIDLNASESFIKNPQTGKSIRDEIYDVASSKSTHKTVSDYLFKQLDWDSNRQSTFAAEERYKAAVATGNLDDDVYYFYRMSNEAQEYHFEKHKSLKQFYASGANVKTDVDDNIERELIGVYKGGYNPDVNSKEKEKLVELGRQKYFHYLHRLSGLPKTHKDYEDNIEDRKSKALEMVTIDIKEGNGVFAREEPGEGGTLRIKWSQFWDTTQTKSDLKTADNFTRKFKKYDPVEVKNSVTPKQRNDLRYMAITGNADGRSIPDNVLEINKRFPNLTLKEIIDDILVDTESKDDMEIEWPTGPDDATKASTDQAYKYNRSNQDSVLVALNYKAMYGTPLMNDKMREKLRGYV